MHRSMMAAMALALVSTSAIASTPPAKAERKACAASLERLQSGGGYRIVRKCKADALVTKAGDLKVAREPVVDGLGIQSSVLVPALFVAGMVGGAIYVVANQPADPVVPGTGGGGVRPASP